MKIKEIMVDFLILLNILVLPLMLPEMGWMKLCTTDAHSVVPFVALIPPAYLYFKLVTFLSPKLLLLIFPKRFSDTSLQTRYETLTDEQVTVLIVMLIGIGFIISLLILYHGVH